MECFINIMSLFVFCALLGVVTTESCKGRSGFQKLPNPMKLSTFMERVNGRVGQVMYQLESPRWSFGAHRLESVFTFVESTNKTAGSAAIKFRQDGLDCVTMTAPRYHVDVWSVKHAVFDEPNPFAPAFTMRLFYFSSHPTLYVMVFFCWDLASIFDGECQGDFFIHFNIFYYVPDMVAWKHIARDLEDELGLTMMDTRMRFLYLNDECPGAPIRGNQTGGYGGAG